MPSFSLAHAGLAAFVAVAGIVAGWILRNARCRREKAAINSGWQEQLEAQRSEHERLVEQNKNLMQQVSQYKASAADATNRSKELSTVLKDTLAGRDELRRELKSVRSSLHAAVTERDQLRSEIDASGTAAAELESRDRRIDKLSRELENWQERLPPLMERFRERSDEAGRLADELDEARDRIAELESRLDTGETRAHAVDAGALEAAMNASNDPDEGAEVDDAPVVGLRDDLKQIKGVGPAIEKTLNELGIFRLHQIAEMTEYDIHRVARRLKGFRSRIYREDWIGQARSLSARAQP